MNVKEQVYFIAIAEECNITRAAKRLFVSQPCLSQFLSKLEDSMGIQLLNRHTDNSLSLTDAGELYYENAQKILQIRNNFTGMLDTLKSIPPTKLTIGISDGKGIDIISPILSELTVQYPDISVDIRHNDTSKLLDLVTNGELDLVYSDFVGENYKRGCIKLPPFEVLVLIPDNHQLAHVGKDRHCSDLPRLSLKYFRKENFVLLKKNTPLRNIEDSYFKKIRHRPNVKIETYSPTSILSILRNSTYLSLCPYELIPSNKENLSFVSLEPPLYYHTAFYYNKNIYQNEVMKKLIKAIKKITSAGKTNPVTNLKTRCI